MSRTSTPATPLASANPSHAGEASSPLKLGLAALFMLPFVVLGLSLLLFGVTPTLVDWARAQQWQATPAIVESAATLWEPGQEGAAAYGVEVRFRYTAAGQEYRGQRHHCTSAMATPVCITNNWAKGWKPRSAQAHRCRCGSTPPSPPSRSWTAAFDLGCWPCSWGWRWRSEPLAATFWCAWGARCGRGCAPQAER